MLLSDLQPASFRGAAFLVPKDSFEDGRNTIDHLYPDSSLHYMEDNGKHPEEFSVTAILHGANLPAKLRRLKSALNTPGPGTLKHPYFGSKFVAVCGPYKGERTDSNSGVITLEIKFKVTGPPLTSLVSGISAVVSSLAGSAVSALYAAFVTTYGQVESILSSRDQIADAVTAIASSTMSAFSGSVIGSRLASDAAAYVDQPELLAERMEQMFQAPMDNEEAYSPEQLVLAYRDVMDAAGAEVDLAAAIVTTTFQLQARRQALMTVAQWAEVNAFILLCQSCAVRAYRTSDEVEADEADLIRRWEEIQERDLPEEITRRVREIVIATSEVLRDAAVRLPNTEVIQVNRLPASLVCYMLYDTDRDQQTIVDLNPETNPIQMAGSTTILMVR